MLLGDRGSQNREHQVTQDMKDFRGQHIHGAQKPVRRARLFGAPPVSEALMQKLTQSFACVQSLGPLGHDTDTDNTL
jgi:hypothetical protein